MRYWAESDDQGFHKEFPGSSWRGWNEGEGLQETDLTLGSEQDNLT